MTYLSVFKINEYSLAILCRYASYLWLNGNSLFTMYIHLYLYLRLSEYSLVTMCRFWTFIWDIMNTALSLYVDIDAALSLVICECNVAKMSCQWWLEALRSPFLCTICHAVTVSRVLAIVVVSSVRSMMMCPYDPWVIGVKAWTSSLPRSPQSALSNWSVKMAVYTVTTLVN